MTPIPAERLAELLGGELRAAPAVGVSGFATDSREVRPGFAFLAIRGENVDGHAFASQALASGAVLVVAEQEVDEPSILVPNLVEALARMGSSLRQTFAGPVVGITGSNGKTTTKDMLAAALATQGRVLANPGNKNTEYTSPLVWCELEPEHRFVVLEMGMRGPGQIAHLAEVSRPNMGIVTCVGTSHIEKVGSREGIARAKAELLESLPPGAPSLLWNEDDFFLDLAAKARGPVRTFGFDVGADCRVTGYRLLDWNSSLIRGSVGGRTFETTLPAIGKHQALNAAAALLAAVELGIEPQRAADGLAGVTMPALRMEVVATAGPTVVLDSYNASPNSTVYALHTLAEAPCKGGRFAVLGEMRELGDFSEQGHRQVGAAIAGLPLDGVLLTGGATRWISEEAIRRGFAPERIEQSSHLDLARVTEYVRSKGPDDLVLVKGSRALGLEAAVAPLRAPESSP